MLTHKCPSSVRSLAVSAILLALAESTAVHAQVVLAEMQQIAQGMDMSVIDTNYYVVPEALNDLSSSAANPTYNYIGDQGGTFVLFPDEGFFKPSRINLATAPLPWRGPYLNYQQGRTQLLLTPYDQGAPLDPWGGPYYLFSPLGLLRGDSGTQTLELYADQFDRYALVSLGLDGIKSSDDVIYLFGAGISSFRISSLRQSSPGSARSNDGLSAPAGGTIVVRGVNLGNTQAGAKIMWGATELSNVVSWSGREVQVTLPGNVIGTQQLTVVRGTSGTNGLPLTIGAPSATAVDDWNLYE